MSCQNDSLAIRPRKQHCRLHSSTRSRRICSSTSLPAYYSCSSRAELDSSNLPDSLSEITLESDLDQFSSSSATLLSQSDTFARSLESCHQSCFLYPLHEPGQLTAQRTRRLRARTASVIMSIPATCEEAVDVGGDRPPETVVGPLAAQASKLRRVSGVRDLRGAFYNGERRPARSHSASSLGSLKASYELGILVSPNSLSSKPSPHSSLRTLVDLGSVLSRSSGDLKTLCGSTLSSVSVASRFVAKANPISLPRSSTAHFPANKSQLIFPRKYPVHDLSTPRSYRMSLHQDAHPPGQAVWSCAKISQSTVKLATRRGHLPRRVFSNPIAVLSS